VGGIFIEPIWQLLKARKTVDSHWGGAEKGALNSLVTNRQYPQVRCKAAGWTTHDKCIACVHRISLELGCQCNLQDGDGAVSKLDTPAAISAAATAEVLEKAPTGTLHHRNWICKTLDAPRLKEAHPQDIGRTKDGWGTGDPAWERALAPRPPLPIVKQSQCETFSLDRSTARRHPPSGRCLRGWLCSRWPVPAAGQVWVGLRDE